MLTPTQIDHYHRDGYVVQPRFKAPAQIATLRERAGQIVDAFNAHGALRQPRALSIKKIGHATYVLTNWIQRSAAMPATGFDAQVQP